MIALTAVHFSKSAKFYRNIKIPQ